MSVDDLAAAGTTASGLLVIGLLLAMIGAARERRLRKDDKAECDEDCEVIKEALQPIFAQDPALGGLAYLNFRQMRVFTTVAIRQARSSFYACMAAAFMGLAVLVTGTVVVLASDNGDARLATATLTAVGSSLSAFLTAGFLRSYAMASRQMSYYYGQPLVHCYLLHAEWLSRCTPGLGESERQILLGEVISASITASQNAQGHLLKLQMDPRREWWQRSGRGDVVTHTDSNSAPPGGSGVSGSEAPAKPRAQVPTLSPEEPA